MLRAVKKNKQIWQNLEVGAGNQLLGVPEIDARSVAPTLTHAQSLTVPLPLALSRILSISGSHTDIPVPLTPFMNWAKTKRASVIPLHQHKTDNHFLFGCNHVAILTRTTKTVTFPFTLSTHVRTV